MTYNDSAKQTLVCNGSSWEAMGGIPSGAVMFFNLASCPTGWSVLTGARGRYVVGLPSAGTLAATVGTALSNQENRPTGQHSHSATIALGGTSNLWSGFRAFTAGPCPGCMEMYVLPGQHTHGITVEPTGLSGTNAPYIQFLVCQKD